MALELGLSMDSSKPKIPWAGQTFAWHATSKLKNGGRWSWVHFSWFVCRPVQRFVSPRSSTVRAASLMGQPKRLEELTQQLALGHPTADLFQLAQALVRALSYRLITDWLWATDTQNEWVHLSIGASVELTAHLFIRLEWLMRDKFLSEVAKLLFDLVELRSLDFSQKWLVCDRLNRLIHLLTDLSNFQ